MTFDEQADYTKRLEFLYQAVNDTQQTIRFIDTKAAFCVTLLSGMAAVSLQPHPVHHPHLHESVLITFLAWIGFALLVCMRVIFPVIKPHSAPASHSIRKLPKFFVHQSRSHHWLRHTFSNSVDDVLVEDHDSYTTTMSESTDSDLVISMCDELLMVSLIRQIKQDRLRTAMFSLTGAIFLFFASMVAS